MKLVEKEVGRFIARHRNRGRPGPGKTARFTFANTPTHDTLAKR